jgi:hypothetical protein
MSIISTCVNYTVTQDNVNNVLAIRFYKADGSSTIIAWAYGPYNSTTQVPAPFTIPVPATGSTTVFDMQGNPVTVSGSGTVQATPMLIEANGPVIFNLA